MKRIRMRWPCEYSVCAKLQCTRPRRSKISTSYGGGTSVAFGGWTCRYAPHGGAESVGEVIDSFCPHTNKVPA